MSGAHAGRFMALASRAGWEVEGVELNGRTAACAARRTGRPVHHVNAATLAADGRQYSAITLTDVLEHIPAPVESLSTLARLLEPGGCIAVKVPCGSSQRLKEHVRAAILASHRVSIADNLVHVNHFSPRTLQRALERAGFCDVLIRAGAPELLPVRGRGLRPLVANAVRMVVYVAGRLPGCVHTPLALNLQAYAHAPGGGRSR